MFARGLKTTPALTANFIVMIEPILAPILTFLILKEALGKYSLIGAAVIIITLVIYNIFNMKQAGKDQIAPQEEQTDA